MRGATHGEGYRATPRTELLAPSQVRGESSEHHKVSVKPDALDGRSAHYSDQRGVSVVLSKRTVSSLTGLQWITMARPFRETRVSGRLSRGSPLRRRPAQR